VNTACFGAIWVGHLAFELSRKQGFLQKVRHDWRDLLRFNLSTLLASVAMVVSLRWLEPSSTKTILASVGPLLTVVAAPLLLPGWRATRQARLAAVGTGLSAVLLAWGALSGNAGVAGISVFQAALGILGACLAGVGVVFNTLYMKRFEKLGWTISEMLAGRLALVVLLGAFFWPLGRPGAPGLGDVPALVAVALGWIWAPIWTFQWGLRTCEPLMAALIVSASPLLTLLFQAFDERLTFVPLTAAAVGLNAMCAVYGNSASVSKKTYSQAAISPTK
jgi:drug/metabolite transporter (DMT)-like permease